MTRIISGEFGGRRLTVPPRGTRPTTDRVREALFSRLDSAGAVRGARVFDLFAGSGALGLEALSRGATHATLVDASADAVRVIRANVAALAVADRADVRRARVAAYLTAAPVEADLVLLDPPYDLPPEELAAVLAALPAALAPGAIVALEWSTRAEPPRWPEALTPGDVREYGETAIHEAALAQTGTQK